MRTTMLNGLPITMLNGLGCGCENHKSMPMIQTFGLGAIAFNTEPTSDWSCQDWKYWHEELVKAFAEGKFASRIKYTKPEALRNANLVFNQWWSKLSGFFTKHQFCGYDSQFFAYFKSVGLENILSYFQGIVVPVASGAASVTENVANTATNASSAVSNTGKVLKWLLPTVLVVGVAGLGYWGYKTYLKEEKKQPARVAGPPKRKTKKRKK